MIFEFDIYLTNPNQLIQWNELNFLNLQIIYTMVAGLMVVGGMELSDSDDD